MRKADWKSISARFNERRQNDRNIYSAKKMQEVCQSIGIRKDVYQLMLKKDKVFFDIKEVGTGKEIRFSQTPVFEGVFRQLFEDAKQSKKKPAKRDEAFEQECIEYLKSQGYRILREDGVDETKLKKELPEVYEKFLIITEL
jgi:predicted phage-related endonuclease